MTTAAAARRRPAAAAAPRRPAEVPRRPGAAKCNGVALGFFGALTGDNANLGVNIEQGVELAVDQFNAAQPRLPGRGQEVRQPGQPRPGAGAWPSRRSTTASVIGIVGPAFSGESKVADPLFDEAGLPIITPSATNPALADNGWKIFHRALGNDASQGPGAATYIDSTLKASKVFVHRRRERVRQGSRRPGQLDARLEGRRHRHHRPGRDRLLGHGHQGEGRRRPTPCSSVATTPQAGPLSKQLRDAGVTAMLVFGDGVLDPGYVEAGGSAAEGAIITCPCAPVDALRSRLRDGLQGEVQRRPRHLLGRGLRLGGLLPRRHRLGRPGPRCAQHLREHAVVLGHHEDA